MRDENRVTDEELRRHTRSRLLDGRLPIVSGVSRSRRGTGRPCIVCRRAIKPTEVECQAGELGLFLLAHEVCYKLWQKESVPRRAPVDLKGSEP